MQKAMIQINGKWITGYCDYYKKAQGTVFADYTFGDTHKIVESVQKVNSQDGRNWFHIVRDATAEEIENGNSEEEIEFGSFLEMFQDDK